MDVIKFLREKFDPRRPMGRKNFIWSYLITVCVYAPIAFHLPGMDQVPLAAPTVLMLSVVGAPAHLLLFRRAKAARIPVAFVFFSWFITPINHMTEGGFVEDAIGWYQFGLLIALLFQKNKVEPVTP